ncbi:MAG: hypothetical protein HW416_1589, partial [Chloroflexi bacterium]|nr:hypothetical protein [Chloroflexota bacterium]
PTGTMMIEIASRSEFEAGYAVHTSKSELGAAVGT